jgi:hypothetical protein
MWLGNEEKDMGGNSYCVVFLRVVQWCRGKYIDSFYISDLISKRLAGGLGVGGEERN